jgi:hypothetical protein
MDVVPKAKAGVGSAVNDATRLLGATLGVAIIGSVYASLYNVRLRSALPAALPGHLARAAHNSVGAALELASRSSVSGHQELGRAIHAAAAGAFFHGFSAGCLVAAGVTALGATLAAALLPSYPTRPIREPLRAVPSAATVE